MASHQLTIAKASLTAGLLRADPVSVPRDEIAHFHALLEKALVTCSPTNIQNCKRWILKNIESKQRISALGKYLVALARSLNPTASPQGGVTTAQGGQTVPSGRRKSLHAIFLVNDIIHHRKFNEKDPLFAEEIKGFLSDLLCSALYPGAVKQRKRVLNVLNIWRGKEYYPEEFLNALEGACKDACSSKPSIPGQPSSHNNEATDVSESGKSTIPAEKQLELPAFHGDPSLPFYDLPAANMLPHIIPNSNIPVNPRLVRPIQFDKTTPSETLTNTVQQFLSSVESMFGSGNMAEAESDAVGGVWGKDGEGYYGWSRTFCEKMKEKRKTAEEEERGRERSVSDGQEDRAEFGRYRRRQRSRDLSRDISRDSRGRSSSVSSRSRSWSRTGRDYKSRNRSRSRSPTYSPTRSSYQPRSATPEQSSLQQPSQLQPTVAQTPPHNFPGIPPAMLNYSMQQQGAFAFNPVPPLPVTQLPPHMQSTALLQQFMMQQQFQQYGYQNSGTTPHAPSHPIIPMLNPGYGGTGMAWPPLPPHTINYPAQQQPQGNQQQQQQSPPQGPTPGRGYGY